MATLDFTHLIPAAPTRRVLSFDALVPAAPVVAEDRATRHQGGLAGATGYLGSAAALDEPALAVMPAPTPAAPVEEQSERFSGEPSLIKDAARTFGGSVVSATGAGLRGFGEAQKILDEHNPIARLFGFDEANRLEPIAQIVKAYGESIKESISDETKMAIRMSSPSGDLFKPSTWQLGRDPSLVGYAHLALDVLGSFAPIVVAGMVGGPVAGAAAGGAVGGGAAMDEATEVIREMANGKDFDGNPIIQHESAYYRELRRAGKSHEEAVDGVLDATERLSFIMVAPISGLGGAATAKLMDPATKIMSKAALPTRIGARAALSGVEESSQEVAEGVAGRTAINLSAGTDLNVTEGTFGDAVLGLLGGTIMGAGSGASSKRTPRDAPPPVPPPAGTGSTEAPPPPPQPLEDRATREQSEDQALYEEAERIGMEIEAAQDRDLPLEEIRRLQGDMEAVIREREAIASPIPTEIVRGGEEIMRAAEEGRPIPGAPATVEPLTPTAQPTPEPLTPAVPDADASVLLGAGYNAEQIVDITPDERAAEVAEAREQGAQPIEAAEARRRIAEFTASRPETAVESAAPARAPAAAQVAPAADEGGAAATAPPAANRFETYRPAQPQSAPVAAVPASPAPDAQQTAPAAPPAAASETDTVLLDPETIRSDPARFQFKSGGDAQGVTDTMRGTKRWDQKAAGVALVWEDISGERFIVDGHQRLGFAKRVQAQNDGQNPKVRAIILREAEGVTAEAAMYESAIKNLREAAETTKAVDVAKVIRRSGLTEAVRESIPPKRRAYQDGLALSRLGDDAFNMVVNERVPEAYAAEVGRQIDGDSAQTAALGYLANAEPANLAQVRSIVGQMKADGFATETQGGLFGESEVASPLFVERARIIDNVSKNLRALGKVFKTAIDSESVLSEAGNVLDTETNAAKLTENQKLALALERLSQRKGPISDALTDAARRLAAGEIKVGRAGQDFLEAVRNTDAGADRASEPARRQPDRDGEAAEDREVRAEAAPVDQGDPLFSRRRRDDAAAEEQKPLDTDAASDAKSKETPTGAPTEPVVDRADLRARIAAGATLDEIKSHPAVVQAFAALNNKPPTTDLPGYGTAEFWNRRNYLRADGAKSLGRKATARYRTRPWCRRSPHSTTSPPRPIC